MQRDPIYRETEVRLARPRLAGEMFDPRETEPELRATFAAADREAERIVGDVPRDARFIMRFWNTKQRVLKDRFGIEWKSPAELSPGIKYASYGQPDITYAENRALRALVVPRLHGSSEEVAGITRDFQGLATVATRDRKTGDIRHYHFNGHDESWSFMDVVEVEE